MNIKCEFFFSLPNSYSRYECDVTSILYLPNSKALTASGTHLMGNSNEDVETLQFSDIHVKYFPRGIGEMFPNLKELNISSCGLKKITKQDLIGLEKLTSLSLVNNKLVSLPSNLLENLDNISICSIREKELKFVDSKMFEHLESKLIFLSLNGKNSRIQYLRGDPHNQMKFVDVCKKVDEMFAKKPRQVDEKKSQMVFKELWDSRCFADFTIKVQENLEMEIKVHKLVLATQSLVFAAMFNNDMLEKRSSEMTIIDFSSSSVEEFLHYFYVGLIPSVKNSLEIFELSVKYEVEKLKTEMENTIVNNIEYYDAFQVLELGNLHGSDAIMSAAFEEIKLTYPRFNFGDRLKYKPNDIKELMNAKRKHDQELSSVKKKLKQETEVIDKRYNELKERLNFEN